MHQEKIHFLQIQDYEHAWDRTARDALEQVPGFTAVIRKLNEIGFDRLLRIQYTGSGLKVTANNFPDLHCIFQKACSILSIQQHPDLYLQWGYSINAFTTGVEKPIIVLNSGCIDLLSPDELLFVIAHELGHIKSKHVLYRQTAYYLPMIAHTVGNATLGIGALLTSGLQLALLNWQRMSEFTADRAGLLACQQPEVAASALVKIAGLPQKHHSTQLTDEFIQQAKEFQSYDYDSLDKVAKVIGIMNQSHPWTVVRAAELFKWIDSDDYRNVMRKGDWKTVSQFLQPSETTSQIQQNPDKPWRYD